MAPLSPSRALRLLEAVAEVGRREPDPDTALAESLERLRVGLGAQCAVVLQPREDEGLVLRARAGPDETAHPAPWLGAARLSAAHGTAQQDVVDGAAVASVPLLSAGDLVGVLAVVARAGAHWQPADLALLQLLADTTCAAVERTSAPERRQLEARLAAQALHDPLTGLANRTLLREHLDAGLQRLSRHPGLLTLLFLDLDRFKAVNDNLGHEAGDELLVHVTRLLRTAVRDQDLVARLGGDEFVVLCTDLADQDAAEAVAERITSTLRVPVLVRGQEVFVSASVGVVTTSGGQTTSELLRDADAAMYQAKDQGRGRYSLLDAAARAELTDRTVLGNDLRRVLERDELRAHYQPLVDLRTGAVVGTEALLRWEHPVRGRLAPGAFLGLAVELRLLGELDAWMLRTACGQSAQWARELGRPVAVWVNLSSSSLADGRLPGRVAETLRGAGLPPELLTLEITEHAVMQDAARAVHLLQALRGLGVQLAVDDFGTGYSSLSYLQQFPVQALKIDRSFVGRLDDGRMEDDAGSGTITRAVVNLASGLRLRTVAEGIETAGQLSAAADLGCDLGQGWFLGRPAAAGDAVVALREGVLLPTRELDTAPA